MGNEGGNRTMGMSARERQINLEFQLTSLSHLISAACYESLICQYNFPTIFLFNLEISLEGILSALHGNFSWLP